MAVGESFLSSCSLCGRNPSAPGSADCSADCESQLLRQLGDNEKVGQRERQEREREKFLNEPFLLFLLLLSHIQTIVPFIAPTRAAPISMYRELSNLYNQILATFNNLN